VGFPSALKVRNFFSVLPSFLSSSFFPSNLSLRSLFVIVICERMGPGFSSSPVVAVPTPPLFYFLFLGPNPSSMLIQVHLGLTFASSPGPTSPPALAPIHQFIGVAHLVAHVFCVLRCFQHFEVACGAPFFFGVRGVGSTVPPRRTHSR